MNLFYSDILYKQKQAEISKNNWKKGLYASLITPLETRNCKNTRCTKSFLIKPWDPKKFCSRSCAATFNNTNRIHSKETKNKIAFAMQKYTSPFKGVEKVTRVIKICFNCKKEFKVLPYLAKKRKFCSNACVMYVVGRLTTSPKASKGKPGIRIDIDPTICFYSTWEANIARVFTLVGIDWQFGPTIFDLDGHTYRPDFYLPEDNMYIEVKNFMAPYSLQRDTSFRKKFPNIKLEVLGKKEYKEIEEYYKPLIDHWES
ncbi:MAG: hypothetical protein KBD46_00805 [Candidatus Levybacteria bacterium]|nr:hypothetical protein [Candidatus Levybacteria bacterium]